MMAFIINEQKAKRRAAVRIAAAAGIIIAVFAAVFFAGGEDVLAATEFEWTRITLDTMIEPDYSNVDKLSEEAAEEWIKDRTEYNSTRIDNCIFVISYDSDNATVMQSQNGIINEYKLKKIALTSPGSLKYFFESDISIYFIPIDSGLDLKDYSYYTGKNATCEIPGVKEHWMSPDGRLFLDLAGKYETTETELTKMALGHDWDEGVIKKEATFLENGEKVYTCNREGCGETKSETLPTLAEDKNYSLKAQDNIWKKGAYGSLVFHVSNSAGRNKIISTFRSVSVDGSIIENAELETVSGEVILTLDAEYLDALENGKHTISIMFTDGCAETTFRVKSEELLSISGQNGSDSVKMLFSIIAAAIIIAIFILVVFYFIVSKREQAQTIAVMPVTASPDKTNVATAAGKTEDRKAEEKESPKEKKDIAGTGNKDDVPTYEANTADTPQEKPKADTVLAAEIIESSQAVNVTVKPEPVPETQQEINHVKLNRERDVKKVLNGIKPGMYRDTGGVSVSGVKKPENKPEPAAAQTVPFSKPPIIRNEAPPSSSEPRTEYDSRKRSGADNTKMTESSVSMAMPEAQTPPVTESSTSSDSKRRNTSFAPEDVGTVLKRTSAFLKRSAVSAASNFHKTAVAVGTGANKAYTVTKSGIKSAKTYVSAAFTEGFEKLKKQKEQSEAEKRQHTEASVMRNPPNTDAAEKPAIPVVQPVKEERREQLLPKESYEPDLPDTAVNTDETDVTFEKEEDTDYQDVIMQSGSADDDALSRSLDERIADILNKSEMFKEGDIDEFIEEAFDTNALVELENLDDDDFFNMFNNS